MQTGEEVTLNEQQVATVINLQKQNYPQIGYNPYEASAGLGTRWTIIS